MRGLFEALSLSAPSYYSLGEQYPKLLVSHPSLEAEPPYYRRALTSLLSLIEYGAPCIERSVLDHPALKGPPGADHPASVSYTHLTLPTICSV